MRLILKYTFLAAFCCLFLMSSHASAQVSPTPTPSGSSGSAGSGSDGNKTDKNVKPKATVITKKFDGEFPDIDGWEKDEVYMYPTSALGYSINYESREGGRVTVYVYDGRVSDISDDANDSTIKNEIKRAKKEILLAEEAGVYKDVKEVKSGVITLGGASGKVKVQYMLFSLKARGQDLASEIYLFGYKGNFIKIRATRLKENTESEMLANLLATMDALFSK
jgi:hypothetical protein